MRLVVSRKVSESQLYKGVLLETFELELTAQERVRPQHTQPLKRKTPIATTLCSCPRELNADPHCLYCEEIHPSSSYTEMVDVANRKSILMNSGRCFDS